MRRNNTHHLGSVCWSSVGASSVAAAAAAAAAAMVVTDGILGVGAQWGGSAAAVQG